MSNNTVLRDNLRASVASDGIAAIYARMPAEAWRAYARGVTQFWSSALDRRARPLDQYTTVREWARSAFVRRPPTWTTPHTVRKEWPIARLRDFSASDNSGLIPVLVLPPQAGHDSCVVDFAPGQSQVETILRAGLPVASLDWIGATRETKDTTIEDYLDVIAETVDMLGGRVNLVGDCQGGWLGTIYAARHPEAVNTLTVAGAPIDTWVGQPQVQQWLSVTSPTRSLVPHRALVAMHGGIYPGRTQLAGFKAMEPTSKLERLASLLGNAHDKDGLERHAKFADWFEHTQDIAGAFYLWTVENLFARNRLARGKAWVAGERVDLSRIDCPIYLIAGERDHITPAEQVWALEDLVSTAPGDVTRRLASAGHLGLFMGHHALEEHWAVIMADIRNRSS